MLSIGKEQLSILFDVTCGVATTVFWEVSIDDNYLSQLTDWLPYV